MEEKELTQAAETETNLLPPKITKEHFEAQAMSKEGKRLLWIKSVVYNLISSFLIAFAAYSLIKANNFSIGGAAGIAILINAITGIDLSILSLCINLPLLILAFIYVKRKFAILSVVNIGMQSVWMFILEQTNFQISFTEGGEADKIFAAIASGLCIGSAIALTLKVGGSTGGGDILAVLIQKKVGASSIAWVLFGVNAFIIGASFFVFYNPEVSIAYNLLPIMLSTFETYIESKTNEAITNGFQSAREFRIITDKPEQMAQALMVELSRGVTAIPATGMYTKYTHTMLLCVVSRRQVNVLKRVMKSVDPDAFAVMSNVSQVLGLGFHREEL